MKRTFGTILCFLASISLSSCFLSPGKRTNYIVPGTFVGIRKTYDESKSLVETDKEYCLKIEEISEDDFKTAKGKNVIKDEVGCGFYRFTFYMVDEGESSSFEFMNFKDAHDGIKGMPIVYDDDNGWRFTPLTLKDPVAHSLSNYDLNIYCFLEKEEKI